MAAPKIEPLTDEEQLARVQLAKQSAQWTYLRIPEQTVYRDVLRWYATVLAMEEANAALQRGGDSQHLEVLELRRRVAGLQRGLTEMHTARGHAEHTARRLRDVLQAVTPSFGHGAAWDVLDSTAWLEQPQATEEAENADTG